MIEKHLKQKFTVDAAYYSVGPKQENCNVRGRGNGRFEDEPTGEYTAEDEATLRLFSF